MVALFASLSGLIQARARNLARRTRLRAILIAVAVVMVLLSLVFVLTAAAIALGQAIGIVQALLVMTLVCLVIFGIVMGMLAHEKRKARELAAKRESLNRELVRVALSTAAPTVLAKMPKGFFALGAVALAGLLAATLIRNSDNTDD